VVTYDQLVTLPLEQIPIIIMIADGWNHRINTKEIYLKFRRELQAVRTVGDFRRFYATRSRAHNHAAYAEGGNMSLHLAARFQGLLNGLHRQIEDGEATQSKWHRGESRLQSLEQSLSASMKRCTTLSEERPTIRWGRA
jgi:hypothetical protein